MDETEIEQEEGKEAPPMTFEEWFGRLQKCYQFRGETPPHDDNTEFWRPRFDEGQTPVEAYEAHKAAN